MSIVLEAIKFNHDPNSAEHDAFNIRKNSSIFVDVPEWVQGLSTRAEDSLAAYAIMETMGKTITIQAKFRRTDPSIQSVEVYARDPGNPKAQGCAYAILRQLGIIPILPPPYGNCLGEVKARTVTFQTSGETDFETFELEQVWPLVAFGLGVYTVKWQWQFRPNPTDPWTDITTTHHKIYTVLEIPKSPWQQTPYAPANDQLPWTEVMDYSCIWAQGARDKDTAVANITKRVNDLGPSIVEYDCPGGGYSNYSAGNFQCTEFLDLLGGGPGLGKYVNCSDCATIVSTFSNILGCDLWQSRMRSWFGLNEVISIGYSAWGLPCGWSSFNYHEVAWKGACDIGDEVFDACLKVDGDSSPRTPPHTPVLPVNMKFGNCGDLLYRDRLTSVNGCPNCNPQTTTRKRRQVI